MGIQRWILHVNPWVVHGVSALSDCRLKTVNRALKGAANACVCNDSVMASSIGDHIKAMVQGAGTHLGHSGTIRAVLRWKILRHS